METETKSLEIEEGKLPNRIILRDKSGKIIGMWKRAEGSWESFTLKVKEDGNYGRFLIFEEINLRHISPPKLKSMGIRNAKII